MPSNRQISAVPLQFDTDLARESNLDDGLEHPLDGKLSELFLLLQF